MKKTTLTLIFLCFFVASNAQKVKEICLKQDSISISNRLFYIYSVIDNRTDKSKIGIIRKGFFNRKYDAQLKGGFCTSLDEYFMNALPMKENQTPVTIKVNAFEISEKADFDGEYGYTDISLEYFVDTVKIFSDTQHREFNNLNISKHHEENIREALKKSIMAFSEINFNSEIYSNEVGEKNENKPVYTTFDIPTNDDISHNYEQKRNRNVTAIGYQIGGYTLMGFNYEWRGDDTFGLHFGAGFKGYTAGVKIHTNPSKNSPFFNVSFKDGGFGQINTAALELGGRLVFGQETDFGFHFQLGIAKILHVKNELKETLWGDMDAPSAMLSIGIGFSW